MTASDLVGQTVGNYRVEALLGAGGMGSVYRGMHTLLSRPAAIKILHANLASDPGFQARFLQEARAAGSLSHPNIVQIYDFGQQDGHFYLVMELITGGSLRTWLQRRALATQDWQLPAGLNAIRQAADAVAYAHARGMVHRDIKPDNLLLQAQAGDGDARSLTVKVVDFGLARLAEGGVMTATGVTMGTPAYMSPEQCQGANLDGRSDIYSLGVVLYEVATGYLPFEVKTLSDAVQKHVHSPPPPPRQIRRDLPAELEQIILRCLAKDPAQRFQNASELAAALQQVLAQAPAASSGRPSREMGAGSFNASPPPAPYGASRQPARPEGTKMNPAPPGDRPPVLPTTPGAPNVPRLFVLNPAGQVISSADLTAKGLTLGRLPDNDIPLQDEDVSRRHLRVDWDGSRITITDLGSSNGTLLADARLLPQVPQTWSPRDWVRIGTYWLRIQAPAVPEARPTAAPANVTRPPAAPAVPVESTRLKVMLDQTHLAITPAQPALVRVTLINLGTTVDHLTLSVEGVSPEWVRGPGQEIQLFPGAQTPIVLNVNVPRAPTSHAGDYPVTVRARSRENPGESATASAQWTVLPFSMSSLSIDPARVGGASRASFTVGIHNDGNAGQSYVLSAKDDEQVLGYRFEPPEVAVGPGGDEVVGLTVSKTRRWVGMSQRRPFTVQATGSDGAAQTVPGEFVQRALIPVWVPPAAIALLAILGVLLRSLLTTEPIVPVIESITVDPLNPVASQPFTVRWQVQNATSIELRPLISGLDPAAGQFTIGGGVPNNVSLTLVASNGDGSSERPVPISVIAPTPSPTPEPGAPIIEVWEVTPRTGPPGQAVTIRWKVSDAEDVEIEPFGTVDLEGQREDNPQTTTRYTLIVSNRSKTVRRSEQVQIIVPTPTPAPTMAPAGPTPTMLGGGAANMTATAAAITPTPNPQPSVTVQADKMTIEPFECTVIRWDIKDAKSIKLDGTDVTPMGTKDNVCLDKTTKFVWKIVGLTGREMEQTLTITVNPWKAEHFVGNWLNVDSNTSGMTRLEIKKIDDKTLSFHGYGKCSPTDCDWQEIKVPFTPQKVIGTYDFGYAKVRLTVTRVNDELHVEAFTDYTPADGRQDRSDNYIMKEKSFMLDPRIRDRGRIFLTPTS